MKVDKTYLVRKYEAGGDPACVSSGAGDLGGVSYGIYQLASNTGAVNAFREWACDYPDDDLANYGRLLCEFEINSEKFKKLWRAIGTNDPEGFAKLQDDYAVSVYYKPAAAALLGEGGYDVETKSDAMQAVLMSRAVQYGAGNMTELYTEAVHRMFNSKQKDYSGWPNLTYVDDKQFDYDLIAAIYDFLIDEADNAAWNGRRLHSPKDWVNGSPDVVAGLRNRFVHEKADALEAMM